MEKETIHIGAHCGLENAGKQGDLSGMRNGEKLSLKAGVTQDYHTPRKAFLIAIIALSEGNLKVGQGDYASTFELNAEDVADVSYSRGVIPLQADRDMQIQTIIYKY